MRMNEYQELAEQTAIYPSKFRILYPIIGLAGEAGEMLNKVKKVLRDYEGNWEDVPDEFWEDLFKELGDCQWYIALTARDLDADLEWVAKSNIDKLFSRKERGVLGGSGDNR